MKSLHFLSPERVTNKSDNLKGHITLENPGRILLLQGPAGPFFKNLQREFEVNNFEVKRVVFHRADQLFAAGDSASCSNSGKTYRFSGDNQAWEKWLRAEFSHNKPNVVILFGSNRPAHAAARKIAHEFGVDVISLEEGYLRAGYITCEIGGNNQFSPLHYWKTTGTSNIRPHSAMPTPSSFFTMCFWQLIYYSWREITQSEIDKALYHRKTHGMLKESTSWARHALRRFFAKFTDRKKIKQLLTVHAGNYLLIPLQVPLDSQLQTAARGWTNKQLIKRTLQSLAETHKEAHKETHKESHREMPINGNIPQRLVFKTHPLDEKSHSLVSLIKKEARAMNISDKVIVLESGKIGELTQQATGMIVINSTSAFSALHHRIPILVLGDAIFRRKDIVTVGENSRSITQFFVNRTSKEPADIDAFIAAVKAHALLPGDFYTRRAQQATAQHIVTRVKTHLKANEMTTKSTPLETVP